jgi:hypothetical protein
MDETTRLDRIDRLAAHKLNRYSETRPATEVWDEAADEVDEAERLRVINARSCAQFLAAGGHKYSAL